MPSEPSEPASSAHDDAIVGADANIGQVIGAVIPLTLRTLYTVGTRRRLNTVSKKTRQARGTTRNVVIIEHSKQAGRDQKRVWSEVDVVGALEPSLMASSVPSLELSLVLSSPSR